jgi:hypothetical protein
MVVLVYNGMEAADKSRLRAIVELLKAVVDEAIDPRQALQRWQEIQPDPTRLSRGLNKLLNHTWEQLYHYMDDEDIPARDPEYGLAYRKRQREELTKRIRELSELVPEL